MPTDITMLEKVIVDEIIATLNHARTFVTSQQKMHPNGVLLYDQLIESLEDLKKDYLEKKRYRPCVVKVSPGGTSREYSRLVWGCYPCSPLDCRGIWT